MNFETRYSWADRLLHRLAFRSGGLQVALAEFEERLYKAELSEIPVDRPVFITALPRAGTTALLNLLVETGQFASHTYREMPFLLCPMVWHRFIRRFRVDDEARERAHADGMTVSADSPEAFEEAVWKYFWPRHYEAYCIEVWDDCNDPEFIAFFRNHMKKVVWLRSDNDDRARRYVSKNNLNIARLTCLPQILPGAKIVVPFRDPLQQATSLHKQHLRFLERHRHDEFARQYMEGIGHFDFGANLLPVNFAGWLDRDRRMDATGLGFWLEYWIAAHRSILSQATDPVHLVSYRALTQHPEAGLDWLASVLQLDDPSTLTDQSARLRPPRAHDPDTSEVQRDLLDAARDLFREMENRRIF